MSKRKNVSVKFYLISGAVPEHPYAVRAFFCVQPAGAAVGLICVKEFHANTSAPCS